MEHQLVPGGFQYTTSIPGRWLAAMALASAWLVTWSSTETPWTPPRLSCIQGAMPKKVELDRSEREGFGLLLQAAFANPFGEERAAIDLQIAGAAGPVPRDERLRLLLERVRRRVGPPGLRAIDAPPLARDVHQRLDVTARPNL
jgi:hypothetical protein